MPASWYTECSIPQGEAEARAVSVVALETEIAKLTIPAADMRDPVSLYNPHTMSQLQSLTPSFDWHGYLSVIGVSAHTPHKSVALIVRRRSCCQQLQSRWQ